MDSTLQVDKATTLSSTLGVSDRQVPLWTLPMLPLFPLHWMLLTQPL